MKKSKAIKDDPPPPIPKAMPATQKKYVKIPAGSFTIGERSDETNRQGNEYRSKVTITRPFLMKATEVTENEWYFVMKQPTVKYRRDCMDCPATQMAWRETLEYLNKLSKLEKLDACYGISEEVVKFKGLDCTGYRLPTEAEWEYAARAGTEEKVYGPIDDIAWHYGNSDGAPHAVGGKTANAFGLHDMIGNASEWVWDQYEWSAFEKPTTDPVIGGLEVKDLAQQRMVRGANFMAQGQSIRVAHRDERSQATSSNPDRGFRPVRTVAKTK